MLFVQGEYLITALIRLSSHLSSNTLKITSGLSLKHHKATRLRAVKSQDWESTAWYCGTLESQGQETSRLQDWEDMTSRWQDLKLQDCKITQDLSAFQPCPQPLFTPQNFYVKELLGKLSSHLRLFQIQIQMSTIDLSKFWLFVLILAKTLFI